MIDIRDPKFVLWDWIGSHPMGSLFSLEPLHPQWMNLCRHHEASTTKTCSPLSRYGILPLYLSRGNAWFLKGALQGPRHITMHLKILYRGVQGYSLFSLSALSCVKDRIQIWSYWHWWSTYMTACNRIQGHSPCICELYILKSIDVISWFIKCTWRIKLF